MEIAKKVEEETVRHVAVREQMSAQTSWIGYGLQGLAVWHYAPSVWVLVWVAAVAFFESLNWVVARRVLRDPMGSGHVWHQRLPFTLLASGAAWGCLVLVPGAVSAADLKLINLLAIAVVSVFSVHNLCLCWRSLLAFSGGLIAPSIIFYLWGNGQSLTIGIGAIVLLVMLQIYARSTRHLIVDGMVARFSHEVTAQQLELRNGELAAALVTIRELANTDPMTQCLNRRAGMEHLGAEQTRAERNQVPFGVILIDVDFFKKVNDTHGHAAGDAVLVSLSAVIRGELRGQVDRLVRWGGRRVPVYRECQR